MGPRLYSWCRSHILLPGSVYILLDDGRNMLHFCWGMLVRGGMYLSDGAMDMIFYCDSSPMSEKCKTYYSSCCLLVAMGLKIQVIIKYLFGNNENIRKQVGCWTSG